ncbi:hypothetical protein V1460_24970 [Streptomyces sp. SCSIO 30461]|uniref:hypothetical protein n=1 Tax=Streptomyces sp. SCSIO 30461 TaxID=3118085 RepID=UPI0030D41290
MTFFAEFMTPQAAGPALTGGLGVLHRGPHPPAQQTAQLDTVKTVDVMRLTPSMR